ncbi:anaerobic ribonucleoside-triphosphate reductase activating protein, partial [Patescibacteria group bacterium]|nr:anaerobic ribonucleoside-triphosphate reductase activating protein [Patescibacteria group bacterium]
MQKTSVIDFPGRLACTVFTQGCNFACPFCHNKDLVGGKEVELVGEDYFFKFLKKRKDILEGVCITGGEPCLQPGLLDFCKKIKETGLTIKLDTNGSRPETLEELLKEKVLDMVAMDVKGQFGDYKKITKLKITNYELRIKESIRTILESGVEYEFRTTVVPELHDKTSLVKLA